MPNQNNFRSDVTTRTDPRYLASRIVRVPEDLVLFEEIPASFGFDAEDNIEFHFYTIPENQLLLSTVSKISEGIVRSHIVSYSDGTYKNYLQIDFTKLFVDKDLVIIPGDYRLVLNYFSDEIGSYNNRILSFNEITPSRSEVQISFNNTIDAIAREQNLNLLREFIEKSFNRADAVGVAEKIFVSGVQLSDPTEGVTAPAVIADLETVPNQTFEETIGRIRSLGLEDAFIGQLNSFIKELYSFIREEIVINGDDRIQENEYKEIIRNIVKTKISSINQTIDSRIVAR